MNKEARALLRSNERRVLHRQVQGSGVETSMLAGSVLIWFEMTLIIPLRLPRAACQDPRMGRGA